MEPGTSSSPNSDLMRSVCFSEVSNLLENIKRATSPSLKLEVLRKYIHKFKEAHKNEVCPSPEQHLLPAKIPLFQVYSFYPFIRLLLSKIDRERESYGIQVATMGQLYVRAFNFGPKSTEAKSLTTPQGFNSATSDYADVVCRVIQNRCPAQCSLSIMQLNDLLDKIADPKTKRTEVETIFTKIIQSTTSKDQKWIVRIILKKLNLGIAERRILGAYHPKAYNLYERMSLLTRVCDLVDTGKADEAEGTDVVALFQPMRAMLCEQARMSRLPSLLEDQNLFVELKMDGERFQVHKEGDVYRYFSRNNEYTEQFGGKATGNCFSASLHRKLDSSVKSVILDGEMLVWDQTKELFLAKGDKVDARNLKSNHNLLQVYCVFDLLFLNGESLIRKPYLERIRLLEKIVRVDKHVIMLCQRKRVNSVQEILDFFNLAIDRKEEGIIIKGQDTVYSPGMRNGSGWFKLKPDYVEGLVEDLDLLIMGASKNHKGLIESFIVGLAVKDGALGDPQENLTLHAVTAVGNGLGLEQWRQVTESLNKHWQRPETLPPYMQFGNCRPHCWIEPKDSIMLQVKATELNKSDAFRTEYTLRFPRITAIRSDKAWYDCCPLAEFQGLIEEESGTSSVGRVQKLVKRHATVADVSVRRGGVKTRKITSRTEFVLEDEIVALDSVCKGLEFCILSTKRGQASIRELGNIIKRHEGVVVKNPGPTTFMCVAGDLIAMVMGYAKTQLYDIVTVEWVVKMLGGGEVLQQLPPIKPFNMVAMKEETKMRFKSEFDSYGDSFVHDIQDNEELRSILDAMKTVECYDRLLERELIEFEEEHLMGEESEDSPVYVNLFSKVYGFFLGAHEEYLELVFRGRRGVIVHDIRDATRVFVGSAIKDSELPGNRADGVKFLKSDYIIDSIRAGRLMDEDSYCV